MGRPKDQFAWEQVEKLVNRKWKCIHCKEVHSGAASRIRNHLSGQGNGIAPCEKASEAIQNKALKKVIQKKRVGGNSSAVSTSMTTASKRATEEETAIDAFVKFLMCNNSVPSFHFSYNVDPLLRELMKSVGHYGVELSLLRSDSLALQHSVLRIKHEVERNMLMLKESWKTTGCTLMAFDLNKHYKKGEFHPYRSMEDKIVIAIYCPKGIIFVEAPADDHDYPEALTRHSPSLYTYEKRVHWMRHNPYDYDNYKICQLNHIDDKDPDINYWEDVVDQSCLRSEIQNLCSRNLVDSEWARSLLDVAVEIHEHLCLLGDPWYYRTISTEKDFSLEVSLFEKEASRLPIFLLIIQHDPEKESRTQHRLREDDIEVFTKGSKFWSDGRQLALILNYVLRFVDVMDTLVPTSGYFDMAFDKVKNIIECCGLQLGEDALQFWEELKSEIEVIANTKIFVEGRLACSYLNPLYFVQQLQKDPLLPADELKKALEDLAEIREEDEDKIDEEVERYGQVFSKLSSVELEGRHPVKLWEKHGSYLPVLRRCALKMLNRQLNCPCKQVKEHLYELQGAQDYILRLNFRMMRHFQQLGDDIYQPISFTVFDMIVDNNEPRSVQNGKSSSFGGSDDHAGLKKAQSGVVDPPPHTPVSSDAPISFPYIDVIPLSMHTHVIRYRDVDRDGNCGYRAIAEALGFGQHRWAYIRRRMIDNLNQYQSLIQETFTIYTVDNMLLALDYFKQDLAPENTWLSVPDMGCLVATAFNCAFVVLGGTNQTFLPVYLTEDQTNNLNIKTVCICLLTENSHFIAVTLSENSPLPPLYHMWRHHHHESADLLINHFRLRLKEYWTQWNVNRDHELMINILS